MKQGAVQTRFVDENIQSTDCGRSVLMTAGWSTIKTHMEFQSIGYNLLQDF